MTVTCMSLGNLTWNEVFHFFTWHTMHLHHSNERCVVVNHYTEDELSNNLLSSSSEAVGTVSPPLVLFFSRSHSPVQSGHSTRVHLPHLRVGRGETFRIYCGQKTREPGKWLDMAWKKLSLINFSQRTAGWRLKYPVIFVLSESIMSTRWW